MSTFLAAMLGSFIGFMCVYLSCKVVLWNAKRKLKQRVNAMADRLFLIFNEQNKAPRVPPVVTEKPPEGVN